MNRNVISLLLAVVMLFTMAAPVAAVTAAADADAAVLTWGDLKAAMVQEEDAPLNPDVNDDAVVTMEEMMAYVLRMTGMKESQLGEFPYDWTWTAKSFGMLDVLDYEADAPATMSDLIAMSAAAQPVYDALHAEKREPLFINGLAQPIFEYTTGSVTEGYSNDESEIIRYCVYVETNYDTDNDGKLDLVKALIQMPRAAAEGDYQAATIYEARPYITGCTDNSMKHYPDELEYDVYTNTAPARVRPEAEITDWTSAASFVSSADSADWYYYNPYEYMMDYEDLEWYDYYLVRGYAVVECGGLGTRGSEGFETCGSNVEIDAFKCVIEWLNGTEGRNAYTDKTGTTAIDAYWSNHSVGMTGRSYAGTTQFGLATTGVEGLKTIVPVAGIASWYEYTNSQGIPTNSSAAYTDYLAAYCAGRYLDSEDGAKKGVENADVADYASIEKTYGMYLQQMADEQNALNGDYGEHWANRDYTLNAENIQCPALIVHGLNDENVRTKEFDLMYKAYQKAGVEAKLLLHQNGHLTPTYPAGNTQIFIGDESYDAVLNRWFSHYLYNVDNGAEDMAAVTVQDNVDGSWDTYDSWEAASTFIISGKDSKNDAMTTFTNNNVAAGVSSTNWRDAFIASTTGASVLYQTEVKEDMVIEGSVAVHVRASTDLAGAERLQLAAMLVDTAPNGEAFNVYNVKGSYLPNNVIQENGAWMGGGLKNYDLVEYLQSSATYKVIGTGWMDLCNPTAGYDSASAARTDMVELGKGEFYDYTVYIQPTLYTVPAGHTLSVVIYGTTPSRRAPSVVYNVTVDNTASYAEIPVAGAEKLAVVNQPENFVGNVKDVASFQVDVNREDVSYQWMYSTDGGKYFSVSNMAGATTNTLNVVMTAARVGQVYKCVITDAEGNTVESNAVTMTKNVNTMRIVSQPKDAAGARNETVSFNVEVKSDNQVSYQWMYSKDGVYWSKSTAAGATTAELSIQVKDYRVGQMYKCVVTDSKGCVVESSAAVLLAK